MKIERFEAIKNAILYHYTLTQHRNKSWQRENKNKSWQNEVNPPCLKFKILK